MTLAQARTLLENLSYAMMLNSWRHICQGHLPGEPPADKSKFLHPAKEYEALLARIWEALGKEAGATVNLYADEKNKDSLVVIGTFTEVVGKSGKKDCKHILCVLAPEKNNAQKTVFKTAYPVVNIGARYTSIIPAPSKAKPK